MGRKRKVDRDTARQSALSAFWVNGYSGLGLRRLEELTGINRFAVQTEFGGKDGLFLDIAERYCSLWKRTEGEKLRAGNLEQLAAFFLKRTRKDLPEEFNSGCLMLNTLGGDQPDNPEFRQAITGFLDTIQSSFAAALENEKTQGTLIDGLRIEESSQMLLSALIGMNMLIKQQGDNQAARPAAKGLQKTIMSWRKSR